MPRHARAALAVVSALALALSLVPHRLAAQAPPRGRVVLDTIPAPSLAGNLLGDPDRQPVYVYLPPGYDAGPDRRYPAIYLLHGILDGPSVWVEPAYGEMTIQAVMDSLIAVGEIGPSIVVVPNGRNAYGASGWMNSAVAGDWGDYVARDVVAHVDRAYRTIPAAASRAITGHSMGGFGALRLAMLHPDVFSVAWGMNPCCLCCLEVDVDVDPELLRRLRAFPSVEAMWADLEERGDPWPLILAGMWTLFLPDRDAPPLYHRPPVREVDGRLVVDAEAEARIAEQLLLARVADHAAALRSLRGLAFDSAFGDEFAHIPIGAEALSDSLAALEVPHVFELYQGDHRDRMDERLPGRILPWIDARLERTERKVIQEDAGRAPTPAHEAAIRDSVTSALERFQRYSATARWDSLVGLYSRDPGFRFAESGSLRYSSAEEVRAALRAIAPGTTISTTFENPHIDPVAPGVAILTSPFESAFVDSSGHRFTFGGAITMVWVQEPEGWRIRSGHSSVPVPRGDVGRASVE